MRRIILINLALLLLTTGMANGRTITVRLDGAGDYTTIQDAIDDSNDGDIIEVADGTYTGPGNRDIDFLGKPITVRSESGPENCIIDCNGTREDPHRGFYFATNEDINSIIRGFTIVNGYGPDETLEFDGDVFMLEAGGAIFCNSASPVIINCTISDNFAQHGGAIFSWESNPTITNCEITGNSAGSGGGIDFVRSSPTITNCIISGNSTRNYGGGISCWKSNPTITKCTISGNSANRSGGGISCTESSPTIINCIISGNSTKLYGGGISCEEESSPTIINCIISGNSTRNDGGAIYCYYDSSPTITNCTISGNSADMEGGGISCFRYSHPTITNCTISGNSAEYSGGGIFCFRGNPTITNCTISDNSASYGGGISCWESNPTITNCIFSGNTAKGTDWSGFGGGIYCYRGNPAITNCNITGNTAVEYAGGISSYGANISITNCILWGNEAPKGPELYLAGDSNALVNYTDVQGDQDDVYVGSDCTLNWGPGNIDLDPLFALTTDYHIMPGSPCIDAGTNGPCGGLPPTDKDGVPRPLDGDGDGNAVADMGAYEYAPNSPAIAVSALSFYFVQDWPKPDPQMLLIRNCGGRPLNWEIVEDCSWLEVAPANGVSADQINEVAITVDPNGLTPALYTCTFSVQDANASNSPVTIRVTMPVGTVLPVPSPNYPTIQAAIDAADNFDIVLVADGNYTGPGNKNLDFRGKAITVCSENGPNNCTIDCENSGIGFYFHNNENHNAVVEGFTITNGNGWMGGGILCKQESSPTITNCTITNNTSNGWGGGGIYCEFSSPTITNCTITGNRGSGIYCEYYSSPTIRNCTINNNTGSGIYCWENNPTITNCTIAENEFGGIVCMGGNLTITNSTVNTNTGIGIYCGGNLTITNSTINTNTGTGIYCYGNLTITNSTISGNSATWVGGVRCSSSTTITNCIISDNSADIMVGGILLAGEGNPTITNCVITGNSAGERAGGIRCYGGSPTIINCTISGNTAGEYAGGISFYDSSPTITNCILWGNEAPNGPQIYLDSDGNTSVSYTDVQGGQDDVYVGSDCTLNWGLGNIDADPYFVEPGYWDVNDFWVEGDYHLRLTSPCVDAGTDANVYTDIEGNVRPFDFPGVDNNGELPEFDMGAYELVPVEAAMKLTPQMLNCNSKGKYVKAHITLPEGFLPEDVDVNEPAIAEPMGIESEYIKVLGAGTGLVKLEITFDREAFCETITETGEIEITVIGSLTTGRYFYASDTIKIKT